MLDCHLWLTLTDLKDSDKVVLLDTPVSTMGLIGNAVEAFTKAQKQSKAIYHSPASLWSCSSLSQLSSRPAANSISYSQKEPEPAVCPKMQGPKHFHYLKHQGPHPSKLVASQKDEQCLLALPVVGVNVVCVCARNIPCIPLCYPHHTASPPLISGELSRVNHKGHQWLPRVGQSG